MAAVAYILFVISTGNLPDMTALASYETADACKAAAATITAALASGSDGKLVACISTDSLSEMAQKNGVSGN